MGLKIKNGLKIVTYHSKPFGYLFSSITLGPQKPKCWAEAPKMGNGGGYYWIILPNKLIKAITERNVCSTFKENLSKIVTAIAHIYMYQYKVLKNA